MSKVRSSPFLVIFILIVSGSSTTPSLSTVRRALVDAVGDAAILARICRSARWRISAIACFTDVGAVAVDQRGQPLLAGGQRRGLGLDVADALVGDADVADRMIARISWSITPFLKSFTGGRRRPSCSTSVALAEKPPGTMPPISGQWPVLASQANSSPSIEERLHEAHVHQMRAAEIGIVDDEHVARIDRAGVVALHPVDHGAGRELHGADEHRQAELALRDQRAVDRVVDAVGAVHALGDHRREGRAHEGEVHLVADLDQAVLDDGQGDGIEVGRHEPSLSSCAGGAPLQWRVMGCCYKKTRHWSGAPPAQDDAYSSVSPFSRRCTIERLRISLVPSATLTMRSECQAWCRPSSLVKPMAPWVCMARSTALKPTCTE